MLVSLVIATKDRVKEIKHLLSSLECQTCRVFEVIIVDQNRDARLDAVLEEYGKLFTIVHVRDTGIGVSRGRNIGIGCAKGEIIAFPDDDCWYPCDLIEKVLSFFSRHPEYAGLTGRIVDPKGNAAIGRWDKKAGEINRFNEWTRSAESSLFIRATILKKLGGFNPLLGPGSGTRWGANEGDDLILRALKLGYRFYYDPALVVFHPSAKRGSDPHTLTKARNYGRGFGYVMRYHHMPAWFFGYYCMRSFGGALRAVLTGNFDAANYYLATLKGRLEGWHDAKVYPFKSQPE